MSVETAFFLKVVEGNLWMWESRGIKKSSLPLTHLISHNGGCLRIWQPPWCGAFSKCRTFRSSVETWEERAGKWTWINWTLYIILCQWPPLSLCWGLRKRQGSIAQYSSTFFPLDRHNMAGLINFSQRWSSAHHLLWDNHICMLLWIIPLLY